jgi:hypothetical protein
MKQFVLDESLRNELISWMMQKPYGEVAIAIAKLQSLPEVPAPKLAAVPEQGKAS